MSTTNPSATKYDPLMCNHVVPLIGDMAQKCGHKFEKIQCKYAYEIAAPAVMVNPHNCEVIITRGALEALQPSIHGGVSRELKAVLAHEIAGHVAHDKTMLNWGKVSIVGAPIIAVTAYELYRRHRQKNQSPEETAEQINADSGKESYLSPKMLTIAKYVAIGAGGLAAGGYAARVISRHAEFAADKHAVAFTKDPEALISALTKLEAAATKAMAEATPEAASISGWLSRQLHKFKNATLHAHPSLEERIAHIRS